jgi:hypothetical protein
MSTVALLSFAKCWLQHFAIVCLLTARIACFSLFNEARPDFYQSPWTAGMKMELLLISTRQHRCARCASRRVPAFCTCFVCSCSHKGQYTMFQQCKLANCYVLVGFIFTPARTLLATIFLTTVEGSYIHAMVCGGDGPRQPQVERNAVVGCPEFIYVAMQRALMWTHSQAACDALKLASPAVMTNRRCGSFPGRPSTTCRRSTLDLRLGPPTPHQGGPSP